MNWLITWLLVLQIKTFQGAVVSSGNYSCSNGLIHFIEQVVDRISTQSTVELINASADLSKLRQVIAAAKSKAVNDALARMFFFKAKYSSC